MKKKVQGSSDFGSDFQQESRNLNFAHRLKNIREKSGFNQSALAQRIGVAISTIQNYEQGALPKGDYLISLAKELGCSIDWLLLGIEKDREEPKNGEFAYVNRMDIYLSAGDGSFVVDEKYKERYAFRKDWLTKIASSAKNLVLVEVRGDSMLPTLQNGDMVMIDLGQKYVAAGCIFAIAIHDTVMIKRLENRGDTVRVISDNRTIYEPFDLPYDQIRVIGRVIWSARMYVTD